MVRTDVLGRVLRSTGRIVGRGLRAGTGLLLPPSCLDCGAEIECLGDDLLLCQPCRTILGPEDWPGCSRCGARRAPSALVAGACLRCQSGQLRFDAAVPLGAYEGRLREAVLRMKHVSGDSLSRAMGRLYYHRRKVRLSEFAADLAVPVPMHWTRLLMRGTNSAQIIGHQIARFLGVPLIGELLVRCRKTLPQAELPPGKRFKNVRGAFRAATGYDIRGARVVLVDDILTTGATCSEVARVLKQAGAKAVLAAVLARAEGSLGR